MKLVLEERSERVSIRAACRVLGLARSSAYHRRRASTRRALRGIVSAQRAPHPRALQTEEREAVIALLNNEQYAEQAPAQVYAAELEQGRYHCSVRTMQRLLASVGQNGERRPQREARHHAVPRIEAHAPNDVWTWDITKCATNTAGTYLSLYVVMDLFSRYVVSWMLSRRENSALACQLLDESMTRYAIAPDTLTVHQDRGAPMTANAFLDSLIERGAVPSHSRPRVSNDNPFIESHFRTGKYQPDYPGRFDNYAHAEQYWNDFFTWYNRDHHHRGIGYFTPIQVFNGTHAEVQITRAEALNKAYLRNPERFVRKAPCPPALPNIVSINPYTADDTTAESGVNFPTLTKVRERLNE